MEDQEYATMTQVEAEHWWYRGLHDFVLSSLPEDYGRLIDVGCGTGQLLKNSIIFEDRTVHKFGNDVNKLFPDGHVESGTASP